MANIPFDTFVTGLSQVVPTTSDVLPMVQGGVSRKVTSIGLTSFPFSALTAVANTFTPNFAAATNFTIQLVHGVTNTIATPTNLTTGQRVCFEVIQSATGNDTVVFSSGYTNNTPVLNGTANAKNYIDGIVAPSGQVILSVPN